MRPCPQALEAFRAEMENDADWKAHALKLWDTSDVERFLRVWDKVPERIRTAVLAPLFRAMVTALLSTDHDESTRTAWVNRISSGRAWRALLQAAGTDRMMQICHRYASASESLRSVCQQDVLSEAQQRAYASSLYRCYQGLSDLARSGWSPETTAPAPSSG